VLFTVLNNIFQNIFRFNKHVASYVQAKLKMDNKRALTIQWL